MRLNGISRIQAFITQEHTLCLHGLSRDKGQVRHRWVAALKGFDSTVRAHGFECAFHARGPFLTCSSAHEASAVEVCPLASLKLHWTGTERANTLHYLFQLQQQMTLLILI